MSEKIWTALSVLTFSFICFTRIVTGLHFDPDMFRNVTELISSKGYPVQDHVVETEDGFLLSVQRIPHGRKEPHQSKKLPVLVLHGYLSSSADWVVNFPEQSLGFILADADYDVWLGNARGNTYSRSHVKYTPNMKEFWNNSLDDTIKYDLPAMIDYVLKKTGQKELYYIGHSEGTLVGFALFSEIPEYNKKVKLFVALGPIITVGYITSGVALIAPFTDEIQLALELAGQYEFLPNGPLMKLVSKFVCSTSAKLICAETLFFLFGTDFAGLNQTRLGVYSAHVPAGTSTKTAAHCGQLVNSKKFAKYDYGRSGNLKNYNQPTPPEYDVSKMTVPVALLWALNDILADPTDVGLLRAKLNSLVEDYCVPFPSFNHIDFLWGLNAKKFVYDEVLRLLNRYAI